MEITQETSSHGTYILILNLEETFSRFFVGRYTCRLIYNMLLFNLIDFQRFSSAFYIYRVRFYIFRIRKQLLAPDTLIVIPVNLDLDNIPSLF